MQKHAHLIALAALVFSLIAVYLGYNANQRLITMGCDLSDSFLAEREFIYPILRTIDNPDNYGKGYKNAFRAEAKYNEPCGDKFK